MFPHRPSLYFRKEKAKRKKKEKKKEKKERKDLTNPKRCQ